MKRIAVLVALMVIGVRLADSREILSDNDYIQAFLDAPEIVEAQQQLGRNVELDYPRVLFIQGQCGFAGCNSSVLVAQELRTSSANPSTRQLFGLVYVAASGEIREVRLMKLVPVHKAME